MIRQWNNNNNNNNRYGSEEKKSVPKPIRRIVISDEWRIRCGLWETVSSRPPAALLSRCTGCMLSVIVITDPSADNVVFPVGQTLSSIDVKNVFLEISHRPPPFDSPPSLPKTAAMDTEVDDMLFCRFCLRQSQSLFPIFMASDPDLAKDVMNCLQIKVRI